VILVSRSLSTLDAAAVRRPRLHLRVEARWLPGRGVFAETASTGSSRAISATSASQHVEQYGKRFFEEICSRDLEGIVAKRRLGVYKDDGDGWIKIKNRGYSQPEGRHELLTRRRSKGFNTTRSNDEENHEAEGQQR
jgi:hypothetical protein